METQEGGTVTRIGKKRGDGANGEGEPPVAWGDEGRIDEGVVERILRRIGTGPGERRRMDVLSPFTGRVLAKIPECTGEDVAEAARKARSAQGAWAETPVESRARILLRYHDMILARQREILDVIQLESGKSRFSAFEEVADVAITSRYYATHSARFLRSKRRKGAVPGLTAAWEHRNPRGVIGIISPWNFPLTLAISDALPALMAGNSVILKPDEQTPLSALWAVDLLAEAGLPSGLLQVVTGPGSVLGPPLVDAVDFISFTGSTEIGRVVASQAGEKLIECSLELGGKNPLLVLADADVEQAADGAVRACFSSAGQLCISYERILVSSEVHDRFLKRFVSSTRAMRLGSALDFGIDMGSISSRGQLEKIREHIDDAVSKGAKVLAGGRMRPELGPLFHEPTILADVKAGMKVHEEETFGPVVSVCRFETEEEAVELANSTRYGLSASVWSRDGARARRLARRIRAGSVNVNDGYYAAWASLDAPVGGVKSSGVGRRHGEHGLLRYTESQTVAEQTRVLPLQPPKGVPQATLVRMMTAALRLWKHVPFLR